MTKKQEKEEEKIDQEQSAQGGPVSGGEVEVEDSKTLEEQCEEYKSGWQRAQADYQNLQRETQEKRSEWAKFSELQILEEFIPVYDNFKKAFAVNHDEKDTWSQGIGFIMKQFGDILKSHGIEEIKVVGEKFSPELHEAVGEEESEEDEGVIIREIESGYKMKDRVLKVAKVILSKK